MDSRGRHRVPARALGSRARGGAGRRVGAGARAHGGAQPARPALRPRHHARAQARGPRVGAAGPDRLHRHGRGGGGRAGGGGARVAVGPPQPASLSVDCTGARPDHQPAHLRHRLRRAARRRKDTHQCELGATARRWGGNPTTRYNWKLNAWNTANDWFFRNTSPGIGRSSPMRTSSWPTARPRPPVRAHAADAGLGGQGHELRELPGVQVRRPGEDGAGDAGGGNGCTAPGTHAAARRCPRTTSVPAPPEFIAEWVTRHPKKDEDARRAACSMYFLDNEPMLWNSTHRDVHPEPATYDELLERTIAYGTAVRRRTRRPSSPGPPSGAGRATSARRRTWRRARSRTRTARPTATCRSLPWYLRKLREHEKKTGVRILDVVDVHFYPQARGRRLSRRARRRTTPRRRCASAPRARCGMPTTRTSRGSASRCGSSPG